MGLFEKRRTQTQPRAVAGADLRWYLPVRSSMPMPRLTSLAEARRRVESGSGGEVGRGGTGAAGWVIHRGTELRHDCEVSPAPRVLCICRHPRPGLPG